VQLTAMLGAIIGGAIWVGIGLLALAIVCSSLVAAFRSLSDSSVALLFLLIVPFAASFLIPGLAAWAALVLLVLAVMHVCYLLARLVLGSKLAAIAIAALPVIGAAFYVSARVDAAGLTSPEVAAATSPPDLGKLAEIRSAFTAVDGTAVVRYRVSAN